MSSPSSHDSLLNRIEKKIRYEVCTAWGRLGSFSTVLAQHIQLAGPPILILSLPRSGSSWLGTVLGSANNALYLREPISQARRAKGASFTLVDVDAQAPPAFIKQASDRAFAGIPAFPPGVITDAYQWRISARKQRRVIIKEVNPLACFFWLQQYQPIILFLVRHPAAVALSYRKLGWLNNADVLMDENDLEKTVWEKVGMRQGYIHRTVLDQLDDYPTYRIVRYEDLCGNPVEAFRSLFAFTGLTWNEGTEEMVLEYSSGGNRNLTYNTYRDSQALIRSWEGKLDPHQLEDLRNGYMRFNLPWYNTPQDW